MNVFFIISDDKEESQRRRADALKLRILKEQVFYLEKFTVRK